MELDKVMRGLSKRLNEEMGLDFAYKYENDSLIGTNTLSLKDVHNDIFVRVTVYEKSGKVFFEAIFEKIRKTFETLDLINEFNKKKTFLKAYINNNDYLVLEWAVSDATTEDNAVSEIPFLLEIMSNDDSKETLGLLAEHFTS